MSFNTYFWPEFFLDLLNEILNVPQQQNPQ